MRRGDEGVVPAGCGNAMVLAMISGVFLGRVMAAIIQRQWLGAEILFQESWWFCKGKNCTDHEITKTKLSHLDKL